MELADLLLGAAQGLLGYGQLPAETTIDYPGLSDTTLTGTFWQPSNGGYRQVSSIAIPSPDGRIGVWGSMGRPVLWSKDLAAVKRVRRIASKASSAVGLHRGRSTRRRGGR